MGNSSDAIVRYGLAENAAGGQERPFSRVVRAGDFVFVSGQVPVENGEVITGGIIAQTHKAIENLIEVLAIADCSLEHVVKVGVWLDDARDFSSFNNVFKQYFKDHPPTRSTVESPLMVDAKVELDAVAYRPL
jgi:reactive intermediate/imine deaminase